MPAQLGVKSSSGLFSALLTEAELKGDYAEDVYLLKPGNSLDPQTQFAVTRLTRPDQQAYGSPVVLLHGLYRNRQQWIDSGQGLAIELLNRGYDVWLPELREHGSSPIRVDPRIDEPHDIAHFDIPALALFVREQTGQAPAWISIDVGALAILYGLYHKLLSENLLAGFISLGGPCDKEAISIGQRLVDAGMRKRMRQEPGGDEYERRDWIGVWQKRFDLLSRWRNRPVKALAAFLNAGEEKMHILAPASFAARLIRWQGLNGVAVDFVVDRDEQIATARAWLSQNGTLALILPAITHKLESFFNRKEN